MRITVLCPSYPPIPGGVSDFTRRMALAIAEQGPHTITVITRPGAEADKGITVVADQRHWGFWGYAGLLSRVKASAPDVVVVQYVPHLYQRQGFSWPFTEFVMLLRRLGYKVVTVAHELYYGRHEGWKVQPFGWAQRYGLVPLFWGSRKVVLTVPDRLTRMRSVFPRWADKFTVLPVGANLTPDPSVDGAAWRQAHGVPEGAIVLLFMGLAHPSKELHMLEAALEALEAAGLRARLVVAGGGRLDHPNAVNLGFLPEAEAQSALAAADLYVLPLADGASARRTSLMNALAAGLPVVSTLGVNTDVALFPEDAVKLVPAGDAQAFAAAVVALAKDPEARRRLGDRGKLLHDLRFSWDVLGPQWVALLEEAAR